MKYLLFLLLLFSSIFSVFAQTKLKFDLGSGVNFRNSTFINKWGLEVEYKLDIDKSISLTASRYNLNYAHIFGDTNQVQEITREEYFSEIIDSKYTSSAPLTSYINNKFRILHFELAYNFYFSPSIYSSISAGINFVYRGTYTGMADEFTIDDFGLEEGTLFSDKYRGSRFQTAFFDYSLFFYKTIFRRLDFGLGISWSPALFYQQSNIPSSTLKLQQNVVDYTTINVGFKLYFKRFKTTKL
ncbi:MAG: hypothetical protein GY827_11930 [Cytophagales bacterium]|nr:hypothetical protein [Cytophagales bacterium]